MPLKSISEIKNMSDTEFKSYLAKLDTYELTQLANKLRDAAK